MISHVVIPISQFFGQSDLMTENSSRWISNNLSLTGLQSERSPFMVFKELFENALDAVRGQDVSQIDIRVESLHDCLEFTCSDNGTGFDSQSVSAIHRIFESHRNGDIHGISSGKFGVGLKAIALLCSKECSGRELSIGTVVGAESDSPYQVSFRIGADACGEISIRQPEITTLDSPLTVMQTVVTAYAPWGTNSIESISTQIQSYLESFSRLPRPVTITVEVCGESLPIKPSPSISEIQVFDPSGILQCFVAINRHTTPDHPTISILRYVNGAPLITPGSSITNCVLLSGTLSAVSKICPSLGIELTINPQIESIVSWTLPIAAVPQDSSWHNLTIGIALSCASSDVQYPSLCKCAVGGVGTSSSVEKLVSRCVTSGLKKIQKRIPSQFQSPEDHEYKKAVTQYIPIIACNLSQVIRRSSPLADPITELAQLLQISTGGSDDYETMIIENLSDALGPPRKRATRSKQ